MLLAAVGCLTTHAVAAAVYAPVPATLRGARVIGVQELEALWARGQAVLIDVSEAPPPPPLAAGAPWLPVAHPSVPGALWIPGAGARVLTPELDAFFRRRLEEAQVNVDTPLVFYCHQRCWLSWNAAKRALADGFRQVDWFAAGIEGWTAAGEPTVPGLALGPGAAAGGATLKSGAPMARSVAMAGAATELPTLAVLDLELTGDPGGPAFEAEHAARLTLESARLRDDLSRTGLYRLVGLGPAEATIARLKSQQEYLHDCNGCDLDVGRELAADRVMVAWVNRVSGLILTLTYEIHDVATSQITARKSFDFRGDNDVAWNHAIDYMVRDLRINHD
jgi:PQQ-dependent catabolism-associated CXXCW motif protein